MPRTGYGHVARRLMQWRDVDQRRGVCRAYRFGEGTARVKAAALRQREGGWHRAVDGQQVLAILIEPRDGAQQAEGVGMHRIAEDRPRLGAFNHAARVHHRDMIRQLREFTSEVTRVAREVGTEGKLGGQNKIPRLANDRKIGDFLEDLKL